jgi:predicted metalloprotease
MKLLWSVVVTLALGAVACSGTVSTSTETSSPPPAPTTTVEAPTRTSLEGRFTYATMEEYLDAVTPMVVEFFRQAYPGLREPGLVFIPGGRIARTGCGASDSGAYEYCGADRTIYLGQDLLWAFYRQAGDAAPALGLAHEWGHHVQVMVGVPFARTAAQSVNFENQADCFSGAWAGYADEQGWLETEDDLLDIERLMRLIGSAETSGRDHGTAAERSQAFEAGFEGGLKACNDYFPRSPVA